MIFKVIYRTGNGDSINGTKMHVNAEERGGEGRGGKVPKSETERPIT